MKCPKCNHVIDEKVTACPFCETGLDEDTLAMPVIDSKEELEVGDKKYGRETLLVKSGPGAGEEFALNSAETYIGRDPASDVFLNDITVSRKHCLLSLSKGKASLKDLDSLNGTYLNGKMITSSKLKSGDELQVGVFKLLFFMPGKK